MMRRCAMCRDEYETGDGDDIMRWTMFRMQPESYLLCERCRSFHAYWHGLTPDEREQQQGIMDAYIDALPEYEDRWL